MRIAGCKPAYRSRSNVGGELWDSNLSDPSGICTRQIYDANAARFAVAAVQRCPWIFWDYRLGPVMMREHRFPLPRHAPTASQWRAHRGTPTRMISKPGDRIEHDLYQTCRSLVLVGAHYSRKTPLASFSGAAGHASPDSRCDRDVSGPISSFLTTAA